MVPDSPNHIGVLVSEIGCSLTSDAVYVLPVSFVPQLGPLASDDDHFALEISPGTILIFNVLNGILNLPGHGSSSPRAKACIILKPARFCRGSFNLARAPSKSGNSIVLRPALADARATDLRLDLFNSPTVREGRDFEGTLPTPQCRRKK